MVSVFEFDDYRSYVQKRFAEMPNAGYGQSRRLSKSLGVHTTLVSQVLNGKKTFTLEQAGATCEFFSLSEMETEYFLLLVQTDRAGSPFLRQTLRRQLNRLKAQSKELVNRLVAKGKLTEEERAVFYSDWTYSAVRQLIAIDGFQHISAIGEYFALPPRRLKEIIDFLLKVKLVEEKKGVLQVGPSSTHVESHSAWVRLHHMNWRQKSIEALNEDRPSKLQYTAPMTLARADAEKVRELIVRLLEDVDEIVEPSESEAMFCLNVDWFEVSAKR